jgi:MSHA biogenesis protein MshN
MERGAVSVINQMLKDLEQRQGQASPASRLAESLGVRTERLAANKTAVWWLAFPVSAVLLAASFLLGKGNPDSGTTAVPTAVVAAAGKPASKPVNAPAADARSPVIAVERVTPEKRPEPVVETARADTAQPRALSKPAVERPAAPGKTVAEAPRAASSTPPASKREVAVVDQPADNPPAPAAPVRDIKRPASTAEQAGAHYQRALGYLQASRLEPAIAQLREAVRLQPGMHVARELLANLYLRTGQNTEAFMVLKAGMDADPQHLPYAKMYARTLVEQGQLPAAKRVLESSLLYAGNDADYQALLAAVEQRLGDHNAAVSRYMRALELNKRQGAWWVGLGISLEALGRTAEAGQAYKAARVSPGLSAELIAYVESRLKQLGIRS